jgi:methionyl-tRNA formyltransferase
MSEPMVKATEGLRVVFFGSGAFGLPTLRALLQMHEIAAVVSQPDRPAGRSRALTPTPIAEFARERGLHLIQPICALDPEFIARIHGLSADAFVVIAYGHKLGSDLLGTAFAVNLHASLLPRYRGAAPINWAMMRGEPQTGVSVITLAQRMDAGDVLGSAATAIDPLETAGELHDRLAALGPSLVLTVLSRWRDGTLAPVAQDESLATAAPKLTKGDGTVSFDQPATSVRQRVHGLTPWPGCWVKLGDTSLRLHRVRDLDERITLAVPGEIRMDGRVACSKGSLQLLEVQPAGGRVMSCEQYLRGHRISPGASLDAIA